MWAGLSPREVLSQLQVAASILGLCSHHACPQGQPLPTSPGPVSRSCSPHVSDPSAPSQDSCDRVQGPQIIRDKLPSQESRLNHTHHTREDVQAWHLDLAISETTVKPMTSSLGTPQEGHPKAPERQRFLRGQNWGSTRQRAALVSRTGVGGRDAELLVHPSPPGAVAGWVGRAALGYSGPCASEEALPKAGRGHPASEGPSSPRPAEPGG